MATDVEKLIVRLEATQAKFEKQLAGANRTADRRARAIEQRFARMNASVSRSMAGMLAPLAAGVSLAGAKNLIDTATRIDNALKVAGLSGKELESVYQALFDSAQRNAAPLETLVTLYSRATLVQNELGVSTQELLNFTDKVALALRLSGQSASESAGALLQLSQALGNGIVQAEEYNSLIDGAPLILRAVAAGMEEAGGSVAKLTRLVKSQQVSSQAFFRAFEAGSYILEEKVGGAALTIDQRFENFRTTLVNTAREFNKNSDAAGIVGRELDDLAGLITGVANAIISGQQWLNDYTGQLGDLGTAAYKAGEALRNLLGLPNLGESLGINKMLGTDKPSQDKIQSRIDAEDKGKPTDVGTVRPKKVSVKDYPAGGAGKSGGGRSRRSPAERFQSDVEQIKARTEAINAETAALAGLNPLIDDYGYAVQKAGAEQDLLNAAKRAGLEITPELEASIESLAEGYATASAEAAKLAESQDEVRRRAEEFNDLTKDAFGSFIHDLADGKSAADALSDALGRVADRLIDIALNDIFSNKDGGLLGGIGSLLGLGGGGFAASDFSILANPGLYHSGGVAGSPKSRRAVPAGIFANAPRYHEGGIAGLRSGEVPAILKRGELVVPTNGATASAAASVSYAPSYTIHSEDGDPRKIVAAIERYDKGRLARLKADLPDLRRRAGKRFG